MNPRRCKCGCRRTDAETEGFWHGSWWFASKQCYAGYRGRTAAKSAGTQEQPDVDVQVATGKYTLNRELLARAHALQGTDRQRVEGLLARWTPYDNSPASERAMREMIDTTP